MGITTIHSGLAAGRQSRYSPADDDYFLRSIISLSDELKREVEIDHFKTQPAGWQ
jgi:hypothetical protein